MTISKELVERVCPCAAAVAGRVYPLASPPAGAEGHAWVDLVREVADLLWAFELPTVEPDSADWYALSWCLHRFVYGHQARGRHGLDPGAGVDPAAGTGTGGAA
ncbi:hypothetical protein [Actinomadura violacea]|uniref:Uncharacterized protein n=1 Tax=Actinomadura violacea TaxID=2819934 RepID=A0ABS3RRG1_9ACTN|nr:hypothetical protein [Actinomadura violacea]MBO2459242.1 hypothetical protein [Actinomadura violacea]